LFYRKTICHKEKQMTTNATIAQKAARRKLNLLELASDLGNVSEACRRIGYSREQFYEIRRNYQAFGSEGLLDKARGPKEPPSQQGIGGAGTGCPRLLP
jgi:molybdenum-dependent DNA-binding transcriptional regulator ModE